MHLADWVPTLLGLAGVEPPPGEISFSIPFPLHGVPFSSSLPSFLKRFFLAVVDSPPGEISFSISFFLFMEFLFLLPCLLLFS